MFQGYLKDVLRYVLRMFKGCSKDVLRMINGCFKDVLRYVLSMLEAIRMF